MKLYRSAFNNLVSRLLWSGNIHNVLKNIFLLWESNLNLHLFCFSILSLLYISSRQVYVHWNNTEPFRGFWILKSFKISIILEINVLSDTCILLLKSYFTKRCQETKRAKAFYYVDLLQKSYITSIRVYSRLTLTVVFQACSVYRIYTDLILYRSFY